MDVTEPRTQVVVLGRAARQEWCRKQGQAYQNGYSSTQAVQGPRSALRPEPAKPQIRLYELSRATVPNCPKRSSACLPLLANQTIFLSPHEM